MTSKIGYWVNRGLSTVSVNLLLKNLIVKSHLYFRSNYSHMGDDVMINSAHYPNKSTCNKGNTVSIT